MIVALLILHVTEFSNKIWPVDMMILSNHGV